MVPRKENHRIYDVHIQFPPTPFERCTYAGFDRGITKDTVILYAGFGRGITIDTVILYAGFGREITIDTVIFGVHIYTDLATPIKHPCMHCDNGSGRPPNQA
jgi:hypothetical protein